MQIKTTGICHYTSIKMGKITEKNSDNNKRKGWKETKVHCLWNVKWTDYGK